MSRQLALVNQADKYLDLDQKIEMNHRRAVMDKGWGRDMRSSAKVPPAVLFGQRGASMGSTRGTSRGATAMAG